MIEQEFAKQFAAEWIEAWNRHDLDRVLALYTDDFEMVSPLIVTIAGVPSGKLKGKTAVRVYWAKGLQLIPNLHFKLTAILCGVESMTLAYQGHRGPSAEVFEFNVAGNVVRASAHYALE